MRNLQRHLCLADPAESDDSYKAWAVIIGKAILQASEDAFATHKSFVLGEGDDEVWAMQGTGNFYAF